MHAARGVTGSHSITEFPDTGSFHGVWLQEPKHCGGRRYPAALGPGAATSRWTARGVSYTCRHHIQRCMKGVQVASSTPSVAELVDRLLTLRRHASGREYTYREVALAMDGSVGHENVYKLRNGLVKNPTRETLLTVCIFFRVPPAYFFPELDDQAFDPLRYRAPAARHRCGSSRAGLRLHPGRPPRPTARPTPA